MADGVRVKVNFPKFNQRKTDQAVHETMTKFTLDTLKTWVLATTNPVPVWSGAARASWLELAARAFTSITINPVVDSRITLGIEEATSEVFSEKGKLYGWLWQSDLAHIGIVEDRVGFVAAGLQAIKGAEPELPQPVFD